MKDTTWITTQPPEGAQTSAQHTANRHSTEHILHLKNKAHRRQLHHRQHDNDLTRHMNDTTMMTGDVHNTTTDATTVDITVNIANNNNIWLKSRDNAHDNCKWDHPQTSQVDCHPNVFHWHSSKCKCSNCESSAGLSAALVPHFCERVNPREWELCGEDGREVMSPAQESPTAKLLVAPRLGQKLPDRSHYSSHEAVRSNLAPPSICTCPSPVEGRGTQERWRANSQKDI